MRVAPTAAFHHLHLSIHPAWLCSLAQVHQCIMFRNTFQSGFLSILYSIGSKPLQVLELGAHPGVVPLSIM